jgi:hypothetical protein
MKILMDIEKNNNFNIIGFLKFIATSTEMMSANAEIAAKAWDKI